MTVKKVICRQYQVHDIKAQQIVIERTEGAEQISTVLVLWREKEKEKVKISSLLRFFACALI
jgi:hypothetical protein